MRIIAHITVLAILLTSCELFGIGGSNDEQGGEVVWRLENQQENLIGTKPLVEKNKAYFLQDGFLKAYRLEKGTKIWSKRIVQQGNGGYGHKIISSEGRLFLDQGFNIQAHRKSDGTVLWEKKVTDDAREVSGIGEPIMSQDEQHLYAGRKGYVLQLRKSDGQIVQRYSLDRLVPEGVMRKVPLNRLSHRLVMIFCMFRPVTMIVLLPEKRNLGPIFSPLMPATERFSGKQESNTVGLMWG